jgi:hypothetical protein
MKKCAAVLTLALAGCIYQERDPGPMPEGPPLLRAEIERLAAAGVSDEIILEKIENRGALHLTSDDLVALRKAGASDAVLDKAISNERVEPEVVYVDEPAYTHRHAYWYPWWGFSYSYYRYHPHSRAGVGVHVGW